MNRELEKIRTALEKGNNTIMLHSNADMDCIGAAAALAMHYGNGKLMAPGGISHLGKRLLSRLKIEADDFGNIPDKGGIIVVDAQDDSSLGYPGTPWDRAIVIDHHRQKESTIALLLFMNEDASSSCEIIWDIINSPKKIQKDIGLCLMAGIIADTGHLRRGGAKTLRTSSDILEASGLSLEEVLAVFESAEDQDISRRVSRLKGVQRMRFERVGEWAVATSEIGAFESAVCQALLSIGADVAFAGSQKDGGFRITGRANRLAVESGIHLGEMLNSIAAECGGEGGGHDGAAGFSGTGEIEAMLDVCSHNAISRLKGKKRKAIEESVL